MTLNELKFAQLLTEAVYKIRFQENRSIMAIQDELGYALGKSGGSAIEYWRKGHIPPKRSELEQLAQEIATRGGFPDREAFENFLLSAGCHEVKGLADRLFPEKDEQPVRPAPARPHPPAPNEERPTSLPPVTALAPFVVGPPITHPRQFFGRETELRRIFDLWKRFPLQNVAVIGPHRSGKTSLLHYLQSITTATPAQLRPGQRTDWLPGPERYRWLMVDFQDVRVCTQEGLLRHLLTGLKMPMAEPCDLNSFMDTVSHRLKTPTLILMDEIGVALASPAFDQQFWWSLRSLASNQTGGNLGFLLTAPTVPAQIAHECGKPSPFFNIFGHTITLGALSDREARELVGSSPQPIPAKEVEWILSQSGRWPALLQILCHTRLMWQEGGRTDEEWMGEGLQQMVPYRHLLAK